MIEGGKMQTTEYEWIACPICGNPHMTRVRGDTRLYSFPAFCKRCKGETILTYDNKRALAPNS
nr:MAG TPA: cysteine-rich protein [Caudoviricetes sp.]